MKSHQGLWLLMKKRYPSARRAVCAATISFPLQYSQGQDTHNRGTASNAFDILNESKGGDKKNAFAGFTGFGKSSGASPFAPSGTAAGGGWVMDGDSSDYNKLDCCVRL